MALRFTLGGFPQFTGISRVSRKAETNSCLLIASIIVGTLDVAFTSLKWNIVHKGQIKPKADWRAIDSPKKRTDKFVYSSRQTNQIRCAILLFDFIFSLVCFTFSWNPFWIDFGCALQMTFSLGSVWSVLRDRKGNGETKLFSVYRKVASTNRRY